MFAAACAFAPTWARSLDDCLSSLTLPAGANLGFAYLSERHAGEAAAVLDALRARTGIAHWVGTVGYGVIGHDQAHIDAPGLALLVGTFPPESFQVFSGRQPLAGVSLSSEPYFAVVHADPHTPEMGELVADMASKVSSGFITGGMASGRGATPIFADDVMDGGIAGVVFAESVSIATRLTQGCAPLDGRFQIARAQGNVIGQLDGEPAFERFRETAATLGLHDLRVAAARLMVGLPSRGRDAEDYIVRSVVGIDPRNGLIAINEEVHNGQPLIFVHRTAEAAVRDMRRMLDELAASLPSPARAGLYFSCTGRGGAMFERDSTEVDMIRAALGDIPLAGFFANGEISHDRLYGFTGVLTLFL